MKKSHNSFIPAKESRWFTIIFDWYVRLLFKRRFHRVWIDQKYSPVDSDSKTIYFLNHSSWWDGLIPFLLNQKLFRQNARAMMENRQMKRYPFFRKIGAFPVHPENTRSVIISLRYALESLKRYNSSLFIYPEGEIKPRSAGKPNFKKGLAWISNKCPDADVVPVGIYIHTANSDKPELFIKVGEKLDFDPFPDLNELNTFFEVEMGNVLSELVKNAHSDPPLCFKRLI